MWFGVVTRKGETSPAQAWVERRTCEAAISDNRRLSCLVCIHQARPTGIGGHVHEYGFCTEDARRDEEEEACSRFTRDLRPARTGGAARTRDCRVRSRGSAPWLDARVVGAMHPLERTCLPEPSAGTGLKLHLDREAYGPLRISDG